MIKLVINPVEHIL